MRKNTFVMKVKGIFYESKNTLVEDTKKSEVAEEHEDAVVQNVILFVHEDGKMELIPEDQLQKFI